MDSPASRQTRKCPDCAEEIKANAIMCRFCHRGLSEEHFKKCIFCAEMVRAKAKKCPFCQSDLTEPGQPPRPPDGSRVPRNPLYPPDGLEIALPADDVSQNE